MPYGTIEACNVDAPELGITRYRKANSAPRQERSTVVSTRFSLRYFSVAILAAVLLLAVACFGGSDEPDTAIEDLPVEFQRLSEVWDLLVQEHIDGGELDPAAISDGAIRGMLVALGDPYAG
ncbi:MAG: hypothetical protein FI724_01100, partial [SAR202 cluster bacterium]|nr:hypothetical protein [SAR202 cluster bacterium]